MNDATIVGIMLTIVGALNLIILAARYIDQKNYGKTRPPERPVYTWFRNPHNTITVFYD